MVPWITLSPYQYLNWKPQIEITKSRVALISLNLFIRFFYEKHKTWID